MTDTELIERLECVMTFTQVKPKSHIGIYKNKLSAVERYVETILEELRKRHAEAAKLTNPHDL